MTRALTDTWTLARRSLRHITRSPDTVITVLLMPIALMLLFVYVWGGAMGGQTGSVSYIDFIVPGIIVMTVLSGISYAAVRLNMDVQSGIINRFRTMPVAPVVCCPPAHSDGCARPQRRRRTGCRSVALRSR